jgi:hypothetical protein
MRLTTSFPANAQWKRLEEIVKLEEAQNSPGPLSKTPPIPATLTLLFGYH